MIGMEKPHLIESIIGNSRVLGQLDQNGILQRFYFPSIDHYQQIKLFMPAYYDDGLIFFEDKKFKMFSDYIHNFAYKFEYEIANKKIFQVDFVNYYDDTLVRRWEGDFDNFYLFFEPMINESTNYNAAKIDKEKQIIFCYYRDGFIGLGFENPILSFTLLDGLNDAKDNMLEGFEDITRPQIAVKFAKSSQITVYVAFGKSKKEVFDKIINAKKTGYEKLYEENRRIWEDKFRKLRFIETNDQITKKIQERSALVFYLLQNRETGAIIAAPEFDEKFSKCGGYGYSWGRDAAFITTAMEKLNMIEEVELFFDFVFRCQEDEGYWDQRYYSDGFLAPSWGIQIDETASIVWGFLKYCKNNNKFHLIEKHRLKLRKAIQFLLKCIDENGVWFESYDLWEERLGIHFYSNASIYGALVESKDVFQEFKHEISEKIEALKKQMVEKFVVEKIYKRSINVRLFSKHLKEKKYEHIEEKHDDQFDFVKFYNPVDDSLDVSILGAFYPFEMIENDEILINTVEAIEKHCINNYVGGYKRYQDDVYAGGNPWIITTLWMALYYKNVGEIQKAQHLIDWTKKHALPNGLLPEQIDKLTHEPAWVVPLAWSHAMFILSQY